MVHYTGYESGRTYGVNMYISISLKMNIEDWRHDGDDDQVIMWICNGCGRIQRLHGARYFVLL